MKPSESEERIFRKVDFSTSGKGFQRKLLIIQSAIHCVATVGLENTTYDAVAKLAKMQRSHVAYYFKNFDELISTMIRFVILSAQEITIERLLAANTPPERVEAVVQAAFLQAERYPKHGCVLTLLWSLGSRETSYRRFNTEIRTQGCERIEALIELILSQAGTPDRLRAHFLAKAIQSMVYGYLLEYYSTTSFQSLSEARDMALKAVRMLISADP